MCPTEARVEKCAVSPCTRPLCPDASEEGDQLEKDESDNEVDPGPALESLSAAQQEVQIMQDLIRNIESMKTIAVQYVDCPQSSLQKLQPAAVSVERRRQGLQAASARLRSAAEQMDSEALQDNRFLRCLADLQVLSWHLVPVRLS
jgi:hypothetical protein